MTERMNRGRPLRAGLGSGGRQERQIPGRQEGSIARADLVSDALVLDFARRWYLFGGGPAEDIWVQFGWSPTRYFYELEKRLNSSAKQQVSEVQRTQMLENCRARKRNGC